MHLTPKELDKLLLLSAGMVAERRLKKGLKLNYPEAVAYITCAALEGAREGKTVEEVMTDAAQVLTREQVMPGAAREAAGQPTKPRHGFSVAGGSRIHRWFPSGQHSSPY